MLILQHPRERKMPLGTAHMASLCLPNSELHVGVDWEHSPSVGRALSDPHRPAVLLYPGPHALALESASFDTPRTLVVVDGTWWQASKLLRVNPTLAALPRVAFTPSRPSEYRIRREPHDHCVSTIEALAYALPWLEGTPKEHFERLLAPFRTMVDTQLHCKATLPNVHGGNVRRKDRAVNAEPTNAPALAEP